MNSVHVKEENFEMISELPRADLSRASAAVLKVIVQRAPRCGVYLLMFQGHLTYVGTSADMPKRVAVHGATGRRFDQVFFIAADEVERFALESALVAALQPPENRTYRPIPRRAIETVPAFVAVPAPELDLNFDPKHDRAVKPATLRMRRHRARKLAEKTKSEETRSV